MSESPQLKSLVFCGCCTCPDKVSTKTSGCTKIADLLFSAREVYSQCEEIHLKAFDLVAAKGQHHAVVHTLLMLLSWKSSVIIGPSIGPCLLWHFLGPRVLHVKNMLHFSDLALVRREKGWNAVVVDAARVQRYKVSQGPSSEQSTEFHLLASTQVYAVFLNRR